MYQERGLEQKFVPNGEPAARSTSLCCLFSAICVVKQMVSRISYLLQFFIWLEFISGLSDKELYKRQKHCILTYLAHSTKLTLLNFALPAKACRKGRHNFFFLLAACLYCIAQVYRKPICTSAVGGGTGRRSMPSEELVSSRYPKMFIIVSL